MNDYKFFFPDQASESSVIAVLNAYHDQKKLIDDIADIPAEIKAALENPDPKYIFDHKEVFCEDSSIMNFAAELDCAPVFKLWIEIRSGKNDDNLVEYYIKTSARNNAVNSLRYLIEHCSNINHKPPYDYAGTALYDAIVADYQEAVLAIIEHPEIDLEVAANKGASPLLYALVESFRPEIAAILIEAGAKITEDIIIEVCQGIHKEAVDILVKHLHDPNILHPKKGITPLQAAIAVGNHYAAKKLLALGAKTDILSRKKYTKEGKTYTSKSDALQFAEVYGDERIIKLLTSPPEETVEPILHYELQAPLEEYKQFFPDEVSESALITALTEWQKTRIDQERDDVLPKEIAIGLLNPDPRYVYDNMEVFCNDHLIMHYAAEYDCVPLFRLRFEKLNDTELIFDGEAIPVESFISAASFQDAGNIIRYLNPYAKNINYTSDSNKCTSLHWAAQSGTIRAVEALLEHPDIDLEAEDKGGVTPLLRAFYSDNPEIAELILKAGAKLTAETVVEVCFHYNRENIDVLTRYVKDINEVDSKKGITPLQAVISTENEYAVKKLIEAGAKTDVLSRKKYERRGNTYPAKIDAIKYAEISGNEKIKKILAGK